ncbi:hypothetical protein SCHPADRAFT_887249 [Schizopora paradoxa]|uniref:DASH complex subunit ASK1 n=1 Tax=Schizopora paradoxa TaxID=27342 RepID=A0A0H2RZF9_9AGAM|nr:hypothetical protein SCHPADRAFT_887249 [Schizopora paradoxa]
MASTSKDNSRSLPPIEPLPPRYEPAADPRTIHVPGLDTTAPVQDQIEQIEQLITIRLQNIDANFARVHQILSTRILPAVRRFAINTEPVRESARFWVSFFEQAAQVRIPTTDDFSAAAEGLSEQTQDEQTNPLSDAPDRTQAGDESNTISQDDTQGHSVFDPSQSFIPLTPSSRGAGAISSTPMAHSHGRSRSQTRLEGLTPSDPPSQWDESAISASIESPLDRLDRGLRSLREDNINESLLPAQPSKPTPSAAGSSSLLQNVLSRNIPGSPRNRTSPLKFHKKPATPKHIRKDWDGIVDLRSPRPLKVATALDEDNWTDSDDDEDGMGLPPGMSPPVTMDFARPTWKATRPVIKPSKPLTTGIGSGATSNYKVAQSPRKEAAKRIGRDLVGAVERGGPGKGVAMAPSGNPNRFGYKPPARSNAGPAPKAGLAFGRQFYDGDVADASTTSSISVPSLSGYSKRAMGIESSSEMEAPSLDLKPPSFGTGYVGSGQASANESDSGIDASLEALMRQVGLNNEQGGKRLPMDDSFNSEDSFDADMMMDAPVFANLGGLQQPDDGDDDSDSSEDGRPPGAPGAGFLMASGGMEDDSFDDDMDEQGAFPAFSMHDEDEDDPTVFGARSVAARSSGVGAEGVPSDYYPPGGSQLRLHSQQLSDDELAENDTETIGMRIGGVNTLGGRRHVPETPTPWNGQGRGV